MQTSVLKRKLLWEDTVLKNADSEPSPDQMNLVETSANADTSLSDLPPAVDASGVSPPQEPSSAEKEDDSIVRHSGTLLKQVCTI